MIRTLLLRKSTQSVRHFARPATNPKDIRNQAQPDVDAPIPRIEAIVGQPLKNIVVHAGRPDPIALPDDQYPDWMWQLVREPESLNVGLSAAKKELKRAAKTKIKANNELNN